MVKEVIESALPPVEDSAGSEPAAEYARRLALRSSAVAHWSRVERVISIARLVVGASALVLAWLAVQNRLLSLAWVAVPALGFGILVLVHDRVLRRREQARRGCLFYEQGLARLEHRWMGAGEAGESFRDPKHLYSEDLDLFGRGSLFELLCTARTGGGEKTLAHWLLGPAAVEEIRARQEAVAELRDRIDLREAMALMGQEVGVGLHSETLSSWACGPRVLESSWLRFALVGLAGLNIVAGLGWAFLGWGSPPLLTLALVETLLFIAFRTRIGTVIRRAGPASRDLDLLSQLLQVIEGESFVCPRLAHLSSQLATRDVAPSRRIRRLRTLVELLDSRRNPFFAPLAVFLLWGSQLAWAVEAWRSICGDHVPHWLQIVGEMEALSALAGYAYEHPLDPFPDLVEPEGGAFFEAEGLAHPFLPESESVRNDLRLGGGQQAVILSGSNMSGKSTLLRSVGANAILALAGAPVRARSLRLGPLVVGASIHLQDSLLGGSSRFHTEITGLKSILEAGRVGHPVLFLLDEILHGTNSHDRRIGVEAVVRALLERGAIGLLTTHDLALAEIADDPTVPAVNMHFEDRLEGGKIVFDYRLRPGVVKRSNALDLMREVGLEI